MIRRLLRIARRFSRSDDDAEDIVQEAWVRVLEYIRETAVNNEEAFLATTVRNLAINDYRRNRIIRYEPDTLEELDRSEGLTDPAPGPEQTLLAEQRLKKVEAMLSAANKRTCAIVMDHRAGYSYAELARRHGLSESAIGKHLARAEILLIRYQREEQK